MVSIKTLFPFFHRVVRGLTGRWARRICVALLVFLLGLTTAARLRSYLMVRKIQAVLHGLQQILVDQTTEEQLLRRVPYLTRSEHEWKQGEIVQRWYYTNIPHGSGTPSLPFWAHSPRWIGACIDQFASRLGYRYLGFDASVLVQNGKVSQVRYGLAKILGWPREATYIVSAKSVHGFWLPYSHAFEVTSQDDISPQFRVAQTPVPTLIGDEKGLRIIFTNDAPSELTRKAFQLDLSCFWSLRGCGDAREIAPGLWQDAQALQAATYQELISGKCPDSIIEGRMRYLPDITVLLLEVVGSRRVEVNEDGYKTEDWFTDYKLNEVIRGRSFGSWTNVRHLKTIPSPIDPTRMIANQIWPETRIGGQVLFFGNMRFDSCQLIPATPSALEIVRESPIPPKRREDEIQTGLM
jgi:hypothetical protein